MDTATVSSKYQIVIPKKARDVLGIKEGDKILFDYREGMVLLLARPKDFVEFSKGLGSELWRDSGREEENVEGESSSWQKKSD
jgi:AbrB family looped-hinge helix DNA binding protein